MSNVKIELNQDGIRELLQSEEVMSLLESQADGIVGTASGSYDTNAFIGKTRATVTISTTDAATYHRNLKDNELLKMLKGRYTHYKGK